MWGMDEENQLVEDGTILQLLILFQQETKQVNCLVQLLEVGICLRWEKAIFAFFWSLVATELR